MIPVFWGCPGRVSGSVGGFWGVLGLEGRVSGFWQLFWGGGSQGIWEGFGGGLSILGVSGSVGGFWRGSQGLWEDFFVGWPRYFGVDFPSLPRFARGSRARSLLS